MACLVACMAFPRRSPAKGKQIFTGNEASASSTIARYSLPPSPTILSKRSRLFLRIWSCNVEIGTGSVELSLKVTLYGPGIIKSGEMSPCLALKMTHCSANCSAYSLLTLKGGPMYASRAGVGPRFGSLSHIFLCPHGIITSVPFIYIISAKVAFTSCSTRRNSWSVRGSAWMCWVFQTPLLLISSLAAYRPNQSADG